MNWKKFMPRAYVPYSKEPDVCIVQGNEEEYFLGVRIENISFPLTISSIQAACCICLSYGQIPKKIFLNSDTDPQLDYWKKEFNCESIISEIPATITLKEYREKPVSNKKDYLKQLLHSAVTPNSDFPVSAILSTGNQCYTGVNVEVSDWSKGLCAERIALSKAIADNADDFKSISLHTLKGEFSSPCGACRQVMFEHFPLIKIEVFHTDGTCSEHFIIDLLPFSFSSKDLRS